MTLQVIGAGFGRTGTLSLKTALEQLGFGPCHHMTEIIDDFPRQGPLWNRVAAGSERDWDAVFAGYRSTVDWPSCYYYAELADYFPAAKVIVTLREPRQWYASMKDTIFAHRPSLAVWLLAAVWKDFPMRFVQEIVMRRTFGGDTGEANAIAVFERHNEEVRRRIPSDRLLEFRVKDGWEPLCGFLGVPVPGTPFPRVNDRQEFARHGEKLRQALRRKG